MAIVAAKRRGDILDDKAQTIICPVNTVGTMGNGLARYMADNIPGLEKSYKEACKDGMLQHGGDIFVFTGIGRQQVLCLATKEYWGNPSRKEWIEKGMAAIAEHWEEYGITSLAIPKIGCGKGQLHWASQVEPIIYQYLDDHPLPVVIYQ